MNSDSRRRISENSRRKNKFFSLNFVYAGVLAVYVVFTCRSFAVFRSLSWVLISESTTLISEPLWSPNESSKVTLPRVLAIYFPQFHRDPINDKLWGDGFTDWDNLRDAPEKNREGFDIPRPTELGYYDLTNATVRQEQGQLAREYGIDGFVFHHYWFYDPDHPGPNLHVPLINMLQDGHPNLPFCLHWCESPWWNTWFTKQDNSTQGEPPKKILQKQFFPKANDPAIKTHYEWLRQFFHHPNYIKVQGQPVFMLYNWWPETVPILREYRRMAIEDGFPGLYVTVGLSFTHDELFPEGRGLGQRRYQFPPEVNRSTAYPSAYGYIQGKVLHVPEWCTNASLSVPLNLTDQIAGINVAFDNTPRRGLQGARLWSADEPDIVVDRFTKSLHAAIYYETCCFPERRDDRFILINAWNEWAEGMIMEPSNVFKRRFLEAVRDAKAQVLASGCTQPAAVV